MSNELEIPAVPAIVFIHPEAEKWSKYDSSTPLSKIFARISENGGTGTDTWIISTYFILKNRGNDVTLSSRLVPQALCVAHYDNISYGACLWDSYLVSIKADRDRTFICDAEIVQSPASLEGRKSYYVPFWPQYGLIPRDENRSDCFSTIGYFGRSRNLSTKFRDQKFLDRLDSIGFKLIIKEDANSWHDYSDIDVVLAIRDGLPYYLAQKPASKLTNSWLAECPAIVNPEPAYQCLYKSKLDYFPATTEDEVIKALEKLRNNPDLFHTMVANGKERGKNYTFDKTASAWEALLSGTIAEDYNRWIADNFLLRRIKSYLRFIYRACRRKIRGNKCKRG